MQLSPDLAVFWRGGDAVQIGFDPRVQMIFSGLSHGEQLLVSELTHDHTDADLDIAARRHKVSAARLTEIVSMLRSAGLLLASKPNQAAIARRARTVSWTPDRSRFHVTVSRLDPLGTAIALGLAESGIGAITSPDSEAVTPSDAPELVTEGLGIARNEALARTLAASGHPTRSAGAAPDIVVLTGGFLPDPFAAEPLMRDRTPHLLAWAEDVDVCVGPLVDPGITCCAQCLYLAGVDNHELWPLLAPQALALPAPKIPSSTRSLAAALAVRAVLTFLDRGGNPLANRGWRIPPIPAMPTMHEFLPSSRCDCMATALLASGNHL